MTKTFIIDKGQTPTDEQLQEVMEAKKYPIVFDEDSPELSQRRCSNGIEWLCVDGLRN